MKQILFDFWDFIKKPKDFQYSGNNKSYKWKVFLTFFGFELLLLAVYIPLFDLLEKVYTLEHLMDEMYFSVIGTFFILVLFVPFLEEVFFRLGLRRKGFLYNLFSEKAWNKLFPIFIYVSSLLFGFIHLTNYTNTDWIFYSLAPFIVLTQIIGGFFMSYLRVRFNFWLSCLYHFSWNFAMFFILGSISMLFTKDINVKTNDYELQIKERQFLSLTDPKQISFQEGEDNNIISLESDQYGVNEILEMVNINNKDYIPQPVLIKLNFKSEKGISKDSLLILLEEHKYLKRRK